MQRQEIPTRLTPTMGQERKNGSQKSTPVSMGIADEPQRTSQLQTGSEKKEKN